MTIFLIIKNIDHIFKPLNKIVISYNFSIFFKHKKHTYTLIQMVFTLIEFKIIFSLFSRVSLDMHKWYKLIIIIVQTDAPSKDRVLSFHLNKE